MINFTRRYMLAVVGVIGCVGALIGVAGCKPRDVHSKRDIPFRPPIGTGSTRFVHGVASGDPAPGRMIIWTRVTPEPGEEETPITVEWLVSPDPTMMTERLTGEIQTDIARDYTVKVDVVGLKPGTTYYYQFVSEDKDPSDMGVFKTLPSGAVDQLDFAIISCANYQAGYFNVYQEISKTTQALDAIIHLGDYFYEYGIDGWGGSVNDGARNHIPPHETVSLSDYRLRHAQYRTDASLQNLTKGVALIALWDDHEVTDDSYSAGAANHQVENEGEWAARRDAAIQAYYEWMPVREPKGASAPYERYGVYQFGDLLTLVAAETRLTARAKPINMDDYTAGFKTPEDVATFKENILGAPERHVMGAAQIDFITTQFSQSKQAGKPWRILANQVVMGRLATPDLRPYVIEEAIVALEADWPNVRDFVESSKYALPVYADSWDGYPWAREQLYGALDQAGINDMLVITGDAHEFWLNDLTREDGTAMGVELGTSAVSSPTLEAYFGPAAEDYALLMTQSNKDVRYYNAMRRGYIHLTLTPDRARAQMIQVDQVDHQDYVANRAARFDIKRSAKSLKAVGPRGLNLKQRLLFMEQG